MNGAGGLSVTKSALQEDPCWHDFSPVKFKNMKPYLYSGILMMMFLLSSCAIVGGIFKAGIWVGILIVAFIIVVILWLVNRGSGKS
jgi:hypothetical protein